MTSWASTSVSGRTPGGGVMVATGSGVRAGIAVGSTGGSASGASAGIASVRSRSIWEAGAGLGRMAPRRRGSKRGR